MNFLRYCLLISCFITQAKDLPQYDLTTQLGNFSLSKYATGLITGCIHKSVYEVLDAKVGHIKNCILPKMAYEYCLKIVTEKYVPQSVKNRNTSKFVQPLDVEICSRFLDGTINFEKEKDEFERAQIYFTIVYKKLEDDFENDDLTDDQKNSIKIIKQCLKNMLEIFRKTKEIYEQNL
jgi:hypothetical protein